MNFLIRQIEKYKTSSVCYSTEDTVIHVSKNALTFAPRNERELDDFSLGAKVLKQDDGVIACVKGIKGRKVFFKKTFHKNKKFHHIFKYCFLPSRGYINAVVSNVLIKNGIQTPRVFVCGEKRKKILGLPIILENSYLITEAVDAPELTELVLNALPNSESINSFLSNWGGAIRKIHKAGVYHGDMKASNFYFFRDHKDKLLAPLKNVKRYIGVWDLDGAKIYEKQVPEKERIRDAGRAFSSFLLLADGFFDQTDACNELSKTEFSENISNYLLNFCASSNTDCEKVRNKLFTYWFRDIKLKNVDLKRLES